MNFILLLFHCFGYLGVLRNLLLDFVVEVDVLDYVLVIDLFLLTMFGLVACLRRCILFDDLLELLLGLLFFLG